MPPERGMPRALSAKTLALLIRTLNSRDCDSDCLLPVLGPSAASPQLPNVPCFLPPTLESDGRAALQLVLLGGR
eukprot:6990802-Alexandrium_andersonii.AAC.1